MINLICVAVLLFQRILTSTALPYYEGGQWKTVPLKSLVVSGEFYDSLGEVVMKQRWLNEASAPITSKYKFALDENAVVSGYKMRIGEHSWTGVVKAKDTARAEFTAAVAEGVKSSLLEKISDNEYQVEIGPIAPYEHVEVEFRYLTRAPVQMDGSYRFVLPTNIAPKFTSPYTATQADLEYAAKMASVPYVPTSPYSFEVDLLWHSGSALREIQSPTNEIRTDVLSTHSVRVHCSTAPSNGHFALSVRTAETTAAYTHTKEDGTTFLYVHNQIPAEEVVFSSARKITIVLDRSGSMDGNKIVEAVQAIDKFLSLLKVDPNTLLNVVSFGSSFRAVYSNSVPATAENIAQIREIVSHFDADFGGTELLECLRAVTSGEYHYHDHATKKVEHGDMIEHVVVLLTDGQVSNRNAISQMLEGDKAGTRVMTVGIGRDADRKLVQQVADKTHAICRVLVEEADLTAALTDILSFISKQYFTDMRVLDYEAIQGASVLYPAHPVDMFLKLSPAQFREVQRSGLTITARDPVHQSTKLWSIGVNECVAAGRSLETLYANLAIAELAKKMDIYEHHNRQELQRHIVDLSVAHGIMNAFTSFLVISDERVAPNAMHNLREVEVPQVDSTGHRSGGDVLMSSGCYFVGSGGGASQSSGAGMIRLMSGSGSFDGTSLLSGSGSVEVGGSSGASETSPSEGYVFIPLRESSGTGTVSGSINLVTGVSDAMGDVADPDVPVYAIDDLILTTNGVFDRAGVGSLPVGSGISNTGSLFIGTGYAVSGRGGSVYVTVGHGLSPTEPAVEDARSVTDSSSSLAADVDNKASDVSSQSSGSLLLPTQNPTADLSHSFMPSSGLLVLSTGASVSSDSGNLHGWNYFRVGRSSVSSIDAETATGATAALSVTVGLNDDGLTEPAAVDDVRSEAGSSLPGSIDISSQSSGGLLLSTEEPSAPAASPASAGITPSAGSGAGYGSGAGAAESVYSSGVTQVPVIGTAAPDNAPGGDSPVRDLTAADPTRVTIRIASNGSASIAGSLSSVPFTERTLLDLQLADGSLLYTAQSFALLRYASLDLLETDAMAAGLSPSVFFNVAALLRAEQESGFAPGEAARRLRRYVESLMETDSIVLVAKMIRLQV